MSVSLTSESGSGTDITTDAVGTTSIASLFQLIWNKIRQVVNVLSGKLDKTAQAADSAMLDGKLPSEFAPSAPVGAIMNVTYAVTSADLVGVTSLSQLLRNFEASGKFRDVWAFNLHFGQASIPALTDLHPNASASNTSGWLSVMKNTIGTLNYIACEWRNQYPGNSAYAKIYRNNLNITNGNWQYGSGTGWVVLG